MISILECSTQNSYPLPEALSTLGNQDESRLRQEVPGGSGQTQLRNNCKQQPLHTSGTFLSSKLFLIPSDGS